jgi:phosphomannomutase
LKTETLAELRQTVTRDQCVMGVAFDGDADRVGFVDETGAPIPGDIMTALLSRELLLARGPAKIVYDVRSSWSVPEIVRESGGVPIMGPVGHANIKRLIAKESALFGGELSMHFYFADMWNHESGDLAMLLVLKMLLREQKPLSQLWKPLQRYFSSGEINFTVSDPAAVIAALDSHFSSDSYQLKAKSSLDGLRLDFKDWWFSVRPSNTEPLLRLNLEARTPEEMEKRKAELELYFR